MALGELWRYYTRYLYLSRLRNRAVLDAGVEDAFSMVIWEQEAFALATGYDEATGRYKGLVLPDDEGMFGQLTDTTLLVAPERARAQREADRREQEQQREQDTDSDTDQGSGGETTAGARTGTGQGAPGGTGTSSSGAGTTPAKPQRPTDTRFFGISRVNPERYSRDFRKLADEILPHLVGEDVDLEIQVEIHAHKRDDFDESTVRTVSENARTLKFDQSGFEND